MGTQKNCLNETVLLSTKNICENRWVRKYSQFYGKELCLIRSTLTSLFLTEPPAWGSGRTIDDAGDSTPTSFKFRLTGAFFFSNDEQGQIREAGFIISKTNGSIV